MYTILLMLEYSITLHFRVKAYHDPANLVLADGDGVAINRNMYLPDIRDCFVAPIVISFSDREGNKSIQVPASLRHDIITCALKVKIVTVICVEVGITPGPAGACVHGYTLCFSLHNTALLLDPTFDILTGIFKRYMQDIRMIKYSCSFKKKKYIYMNCQLRIVLPYLCGSMP